ncbi:MAG: class I SAM-dependent methyltransferase [Paucibacter sp.]|nr:class I SAM-dependent methyltransferase [Roseateles sp.]
MRWLPWPLPALLSWAAAWAIFLILGQPEMIGWAPALCLAALAGAGLALLQTRRWRRVIVALGFPLSVLTLTTAVPAWAWLLPAALLLLVYPASTWRDAPLYPTPRGALQCLPELAPIPAGAAILDLGCGLGHGLRELRQAYPEARLVGLEWSRPLALVCRWLCPFATVERGDMWARSWQGFALIYVFQRPESMERVWEKAQRELASDAWLVSLDFEVPGQEPLAQVNLARGHSLWVYKPANVAQMPH